MDLMNEFNRRRVISEINGQENQDRRAESFAQDDIYKSKIKPYVIRLLESRYSTQTVAEMPIVSSVNLSKKIVDQKASIYKDSPTREFMNMSDEQVEKVSLIYSDAMVDTKLLWANRYYKLQNQTHLMVVPQNGKITLRVLKNHQIDAIPDPMNPEIAAAYILSGFDKTQGFLDTTDGDLHNQVIADKDDAQDMSKIYVVWTPEHHFVMDYNGNIISEKQDNPIGMMPIIDISANKDFTYFVDEGNNIVDFTVKYNTELSMLGQIVSMQGFAQAYFKGPKDMMPENIQIGPNYVLRLPTDAATDTQTEFGYANPNSDLSGAQAYVESLLSQFLSSEGIDPKTIVGSASMAQSFSSGIERLLSLIEKFEASRSDFALFEMVEEKLFAIIKAWINVLQGTEQLDEKYKVTLPENAEISVSYATPEMIRTEQETLEVVARKMELGLASRVDSIMELYNMEKAEALEKIKEIDEMEFISGVRETNIQQEEELPEN